MRSAGRSPFCKGRCALPTLRKANKRLTTAYLPQGVLCQLWGCQTESGARAFFNRWNQSLKWQRLTPY